MVWQSVHHQWTQVGLITARDIFSNSNYDHITAGYIPTDPFGKWKTWLLASSWWTLLFPLGVLRWDMLMLVLPACLQQELTCSVRQTGNSLFYAFILSIFSPSSWMDRFLEFSKWPESCFTSREIDLMVSDREELYDTMATEITTSRSFSFYFF